MPTKSAKFDNRLLRLTTLAALILGALLCIIAAFAKTDRVPPRHFLLPRAAQASAPAAESSTAANPNWVVKSHGECCEGNLAAYGNNTYVLLPVLVTGNRILKSADGGNTWVQKYPPAPASIPFGIEGDMQAYGTDVIFFGTELGVMITAHSDDFGETFIPVQNPVASAGNDQAWSYLGPFGDLRPGGRLPTDEPYVLAGWMRIGSAVVFSFDGGLTYPLQTPLIGVDGSGGEHIVCQQSAHEPTSAGDTRIANPEFRNQKSGRYGAWGTDRKFYWAEPSIAGIQGNDGELYVCKTDNFGATWTGVKHSIVPGAGQDFVVLHTAFDNKGTLYVLHGDQLYVSFNQGENFAFVHTIPHYGSVRLSDPGSDQFFVVNCGTIHIAVAEAANTGGTNMWYLRGSRVDTANPVWDEELVENVGTNRLDFIQIVVNGNNIPTISYTKPAAEVTTASRKSPMAPNGPDTCAITPVSAVSRKTHGSAGNFDVPLPLTGTPGIENRNGGANGDHQIVMCFDAPVTIGSVTASCGSVSGSPVLAGNCATVNLTGVPNASRCSISFNNVSNGLSTTNIIVPVNFLLGDTTADGFVNSADIAQTKSKSGQAVDATNFRQDVTVDGNLNSADIALVKSKSGTALP